MDIKYSKALIFDLDDTLYKERTYLESAFLEIAEIIAGIINENSNIILEEMLQLFNNDKEVFNTVLMKFKCNLSSKQLVTTYRKHKPKIQLPIEQRCVLDTLLKMRIPMGLLTDGRSEQQRNKIKALGVAQYFEKIVISEEFGSEKPCEKNYLVFEDFFKAEKYIYIGDNTKKDFISPNKLAWDSICLFDNGLNIHKQDFTLPNSYLPKHKVFNFQEILDII